MVRDLEHSRVHKVREVFEAADFELPRTNPQRVEALRSLAACLASYPVPLALKADFLELLKPVRDDEGRLEADGDRIRAVRSERFARFRRRHLNGQLARIYSFDWSVVEALLREGAFAPARELLTHAMPFAFFTPRTHRYLHLARRGEGVASEAVESMLTVARLLEASLLATGDGAPHSPYPITCLLEERDILRCRGLKKVQHRTFRRGTQIIDRVVCSYGAEVHFDITEGFLAALAS